MDFPKDEIINTAKKVVEVFSKNYIKCYTLALVRQIKIETNAPPAPDWQLQTRPPWNKPYKSGYLTKEGAIRKSWKKRWFVARPDHTVAYFVDEATSQKENPSAKGVINLSGYSVNVDPNDSVLNRLKRLAEKMGVDFSGLPKPKEYPPLTFELHHWRRRCYFITAENQEQFDDWVAQFRNCCWYAYGLSWDDIVHKVAFPEAVRKTRWELGRWGWYGNYGSEEQILAELIADELDWEIMGRVYSKLAGPWFIRSMLRNKVQKAIDSLVLAAVKPGWAAMHKAVEELRPVVEPKIREVVQPIFEAEKAIIEKLKDAVMSVITPLQEEHVNPHLKKAIDIIRVPVKEGFGESYKIWDEKISKWEPKDDLQHSFSDLDWFPRSYWEMRAATSKAEEMYRDLEDLRIIFKDIYPWSLCYHATSSIRQITDNAVYTFEQGITENGAEGKPDAERIAKIKEETMEKFHHDAEIALVHFCKKVLKLIILPPFEALLHPASKHLIEPLASAIPDPVKDFIDINQDFEDLYHGILDEAIENAINSANA